MEHQFLGVYVSIKILSNLMSVYEINSYVDIANRLIEKQTVETIWCLYAHIILESTGRSAEVSVVEISANSSSWCFLCQF